MVSILLLHDCGEPRRCRGEPGRNQAADVCAQDPERVARYMVTKGYEKRYEVALEVLKNLSYRRWRDMNREDTVRFFAMRMHEAKIIKSSPQKIITQRTDWRFLNELKKELKA